MSFTEKRKAWGAREGAFGGEEGNEEPTCMVERPAGQAVAGHVRLTLPM